MNRYLPLLVLIALTGCAGAKLEKQKKEIDELQTKAGSLYSQLKETATEAETLKAAKAELEARLVEVSGRADAAEARVASLSNSNRSLSDAIGASKDDLGGKLNAVVAEKDALAKKLSDTLKEKLALERLKTVYQSAREKTVRELDKLKGEREALLLKVAGADTTVKAAAEARSAAVLKTREEMGSVADAVLGDMQNGLARVDQSGETFTLSLSDSALFEEGSAKLGEKGEALLTRVGTALKGLSGKSFFVQANSDNSAFKKGLLGGYAGHWELTAARATSVARWLHEHAGLDPARLSAAGFGEFRPVKPNDTGEGRAANRRVAVVVSPAP
ncbi:MAG: OmpA family protein [Elusimicrobia bacterium]|nr:OmpA family protein [Elusimicrobiota bacterium]